MSGVAVAPRGDDFADSGSGAGMTLWAQLLLPRLDRCGQVPRRGGGVSATSVTVISTVAVSVPPGFPSRASTVSVYDYTLL